MNSDWWRDRSRPGTGSLLRCDLARQGRRPGLLPFTLILSAGVFKIWGIFSDESRFILETLNCVFGALTVIPIYGIANRAFGKNVAAGAAWAWVFLPASFFFAITWIWDTALAALFLALIFWATLAMREAKSIWPWAGYGALWVTGVLINPSLLSLFPFLAGWALWQSHRDSSSRIKFCCGHASGLCHWPGSMDDSQLSRVRQIHPAALEFRAGIVAWQ